MTIILDPELPSGCPNATAPPFTFTLDASNPKILLLARPTTEKASLNSKKSISDISSPAFLRAIGKALAGAVVKFSGSELHQHKKRSLLMVLILILPFFL